MVPFISSRLLIINETIVMASTGVCSALMPTRPFSKTSMVTDLSNQRLRQLPPWHSRATSCFDSGLARSIDRQQIALSTSANEAAVPVESGPC